MASFNRPYSKLQCIDKSCIEHSGFICLDFDKTTKEEILQNSKYIYAAFLSPTGTGVKVLVRIPADISTHGARFDALREYFNHASFDPKTRDLSRLCFDSYDPDINSEVAVKRLEPTALTTEIEYHIFDVINIQKLDSTFHERTIYLHSLKDRIS